MNKTIHALLTVFAVLVVAMPHLAPAEEIPADIADMKVQDLRAGGDDKKRYFVIQRPVEPPKDGWRTLFVLPGGSGDAQFQPFVTRIAKNAVPEGYLVVQLVAPVWTPQQAQNMVWPGEKSGVREVKFSTTDFFLAVRKELAKAHKLDPRYSFTLTWSSSGMSGYGFSLHPKSGITGTFVAMSVFQPADLPRAVRGQRPSVFHLSFAAGFHSHRAGGSGPRCAQKGGCQRRVSDLRGRPRLAGRQLR